ncbi:MAG: transcription initiation factor IIB, partial [Thermoplasmata archaeon]
IMSRYLKLNIMPSKPEDYISRFCSKLKLSMDTRSRSMEILKQAENTGLTSGKGPTGVAAAAIYIASLMTGERRTQRAVAEVAGVTEVTIRNRYKELTEKLSLNVEQ